MSIEVTQREAIARIIDPVGWRIRGAHLLAANCDDPVDQWRAKADTVVAGSLAKADAILSALSPSYPMENYNGE